MRVIRIAVLTLKEQHPQRQEPAPLHAPWTSTTRCRGCLRPACARSTGSATTGAAARTRRRGSRVDVRARPRPCGRLWALCTLRPTPWAAPGGGVPVPRRRWGAESSGDTTMTDSLALGRRYAFVHAHCYLPWRARTRRVIHALLALSETLNHTCTTLSRKCSELGGHPQRVPLTHALIQPFCVPSCLLAYLVLVGPTHTSTASCSLLHLSLLPPTPLLAPAPWSLAVLAELGDVCGGAGRAAQAV